MAAAYLRNRMYHQRMIKETPYFLLTGKKPSIKNLHIFGSICYAHVHEAKKLEARSEKGIFIGYDKYSPAYLIYFPSSNRIKKSRTVTFTEKFDFGVANETKKNNNTQFDIKQTISTNQQNIYSGTLNEDNLSILQITMGMFYFSGISNIQVVNHV